MRIYWRNILYNYTIRLYMLYKYRNSEWKEFYCVKLVQTQKEMDTCIKNISKLLTGLSYEDNKSL